MNFGPLFGWPFGALLPQSYHLMMIDPPWEFRLRTPGVAGEGKSPQKHYRCLPTQQIIDLFPIMDLAAPDCILLLWATNPMIEDGLRVMRAWGFDYRTKLTWVKTTSTDKLTFGTGYILRNCDEPLLLGVRGKPRVKDKSIRSTFFGRRGRHSEKPVEAYRIAERMCPTGRKVEIFSRTNRKGWDCFGDEVGKFGDADEMSPANENSSRVIENQRALFAI